MEMLRTSEQKAIEMNVWFQNLLTKVPLLDHETTGCRDTTQSVSAEKQCAKVD